MQRITICFCLVAFFTLTNCERENFNEVTEIPEEVTPAEVEFQQGFALKAQEEDVFVSEGDARRFIGANNFTSYAGTNPYENDSKVVYVVSVSGPKMYSITEQPWMDRAAENTQLFQVIEVMEKEIRYRAYTVDGMLYDGFEINKRPGKTNRVKALKVSLGKERRFKNTLNDPDER